VASSILQGNDTSSPPFSQDEGAHGRRLKWAIRALDNGKVAEATFKAVVGALAPLSQAQIVLQQGSSLRNEVEKLVDGLSHEM